MKDKSAKQVLFALMCVIGYTVLIHAFSDWSWWAALSISGGIQTILGMREELRALRGELNQLNNYFSIADAELVRVSALTTEHADKFWDIQKDMIRVSQELEEIR